MRKTKSLLMAAIAAAAIPFHTGIAAAEGVLRIGIVADPDTFDPAPQRLAAARLVQMSMCDKLFDTDSKTQIVPQLASSYEVAGDGMSITVKLRPDVKFQDGEPVDAEAVKFNYDRNVTLQGSLRRAELDGVKSVEIIDPLTVRYDLNSPQARVVLLNLAERAGFVISPKAVEKLGDKFGTQPVCAGPYRFVEWIPQGRIVVERFADYWDAERIKDGPDRIEYLPIYDSTIRVAALRSGEIQMGERLAASDLSQIQNDPNLTPYQVPGFGHIFVVYNVGNGSGPKPFSDVRVRKAVDLAIDRKILVQALFDNQYIPGNQFVGPSSPYYNPSYPVPERNVEEAKKLLAEAGVPNLKFSMLVPDERERREVAQFLQSMLAEAGITMEIVNQENAAMLESIEAGKFDASLGSWSGRPHPDGNSFSHFGCEGSHNDGKYCSQALDALLEKGRESVTDEDMVKNYQAANALFVEDVPVSILYHPTRLFGVSKKVTGYDPNPDTNIRVQPLRIEK